MEQEFIKTQYQILQNELHSIQATDISKVKKLSAVINAVRLSLDSLKNHVLEEGFTTQQEEIYFFKYEKPRFLSEQLFALEIFTVETNCPIGSDELAREFYKEELRYIRRFFAQYNFIFQYYQLDATEMDRLFFVRGVRPADLILPDVQDFDPVFSTSADYLYAKFMAYEKVQRFLADSLTGGIEHSKSQDPGGNRKQLRWTGAKSDLIELAYGIYTTMQINNGNADVADIVKWLEQSFDVSVGRYYQAFSEIKARKTISKTRYIDQMKDTLIKHIDSGDAFLPGTGLK